MKFFCDKNAILNEVINCSDFTQQRNALSILSNIYLETRNDKLIIKATNNAMGFSTQIAVETIEEGSTTVFCEKFLEIIKLLPDCKILFETDERNMNIIPQDKTITYKSSLRFIDAAEFPPLQSPPEGSSFFSVGQEAFNEMFDQTQFSICSDESRPHICGLRLEKTGNGINAIATDGKRLSMVKRRFKETIADFKAVTVPSKFFVELKKLSTGEGLLDLCVTENVIFSRIGNRFFYSTLVKQAFPDYQRVIPQTQDYHCSIRTSEMINAVKRVAVSIESKSCKLYLQLEANQITMYSEENELGESRERIACSYEGTPCTICLNYQFLLSPLKVMESETFTMAFSDTTRAIMFFPDGEYDYFHLIMPMQSNRT